MALSDEDLLSLLSRRSKRAVTNERERIWPHGIIPYEISEQFDGMLNHFCHFNLNIH